MGIGYCGDTSDTKLSRLPRCTQSRRYQHVNVDDYETLANENLVSNQSFRLLLPLYSLWTPWDFKGVPGVAIVYQTFNHIMQLTLGFQPLFPKHLHTLLEPLYSVGKNVNFFFSNFFNTFLCEVICIQSRAL